VWSIFPYHGQLYFGNGGKWDGYLRGTKQDNKDTTWLVPIERYDPRTGRFARALFSDDAEIDHFRVFDDRLYVAGIYGASNRGGGPGYYEGNYYVARDTSWRIVRHVFDAVHCYDVVVYHGTTFIGIGSTSGAEVATTTDEGRTLRYLHLPALVDSRVIGEWPARVYHFVVLHDVLYALTNRHGVYRYENGQFVPLTVDLYPSAGPVSTFPDETMMVEREATLGTDLVYVAGAGAYDHQWEPVALFATHDVTRVRRVPMPDGAMPYDVLAEGGGLDVLTNTPVLDSAGRQTGYDVVVYRTTDLVHWAEAVRLHLPTLVRSLARLDGVWYFGLGCLVTSPSSRSGEILRLRTEPATR
jgi:hypothetical protein